MLLYMYYYSYNEKKYLKYTCNVVDKFNEKY